MPPQGDLAGPADTETRDEAGDGIRTHDNHVGNVVLYQLSYTRKWFTVNQRGKILPRRKLASAERPKSTGL